MADSFSYEQLIASGEGRLFGADSGRLPLPPMLMFDRITHIDSDGGAHGLGKIRAELDVKPDLWFFACHFQGDPVMPGCLGLDAMWQLIGFYLTWLQLPGRGRALGAGEVKFTGEVGPDVKLVTYEIDIKRVMRGKLKLSSSGSSCVARMMVVPSRLSSTKSRTSLCESSGSTLPVGSSARRMSGRPMTARAMAARCFSPPDSSGGSASMRSPSPTHSSSSFTLSR